MKFIYRGHHITYSRLAHNHYLILVRKGKSEERLEITCSNHEDVDPRAFAKAYVDTVEGK